MATMQFKEKYTIKQDLAMPKLKAAVDFKQVKTIAKKALFQGIQKASTYIAEDLKKALNNSIDSQWSWIQGSRDIIDTGRLKASASLITKTSRTGIVIQGEYSTPYAVHVHYGSAIQPYGNRNAATVLLPARPWITAVFEGSHGQPKFDVKAPLDKAIAEAWSAYFGV